MTPADKVVSCLPTDTVLQVLDLTLGALDLGAVVVLNPDGDKLIPLGIVTKSDLLTAYKNGLKLDQKVEDVMSRTIEYLQEDDHRDKAAEHFEATKHHHAFVVDKNKQWVGLVTAWSVAIECAKDDQAWPWNRGSVEYIAEHYSPHTKKKILKAPKVPDVEPHSFLGIAGATE